MKKFLLLIPFTFLMGAVIISGCGQQSKSRSFVISTEQPASALTIGWYVPVHLLEEVVGKNYKPRVVKDDRMSAVMLYIVASEEHSLDGQELGPMECAHLVVPVEKPDGLSVEDSGTIGGAMACPLNIVDQSKELGDKYNDFTFATYTGGIELNIEETDDKYQVKAKVETSNGLIEINGLFDKEGETKEVVSAMFSTKSENHNYFYGEEKMTRFMDGKGNLSTSGQNIIDAMNLKGQPYFLRFDRDISWSFDFIKQ
jgi:hypothetical protein